MVEKHSTKVRKHNKRKNIKELIKAKRNLRMESKEATKEERYKIVTKIKIIDEEIKKEDQKQYLGMCCVHWTPDKRQKWDILEQQQSTSLVDNCYIWVQNIFICLVK